MGAEEIIALVVGNGVFAALFTWLLFYVLKDAKTREAKYQETIKTLTGHLGEVINEVKEEVGEIKQKIDTIIEKEKSRN